MRFPTFLNRMPLFYGSAVVVSLGYTEATFGAAEVAYYSVELALWRK